MAITTVRVTWISIQRIDCIMKLTIALVIKDFVKTGGAEKYAVEIALRMKKRGHRIDLYARNIDPSLTHGINVFKIPNKLSFSSILSLYSFAKDSALLVKKKHYDIIHSHDKGCPGHVSTVHTFSFKRGIEHMSWLKKINEFIISPRAWLYLYLEGLQMKSDCLAAVSEIIKTDIQSCHNRTHGIDVIQPGVDIEVFCPANLSSRRKTARSNAGLKHGELAVLFIGSEFRRKGLDHLIPALSSDMKLFVVGRQERMEHYKKMVDFHGLNNRVIFTGLTDNVMEYYALSDVVVLPSIAEAFGMTVLEGMACGLPVITSREAGSSHLITTGKNGMVFDSPAQITGMLEALKNEATRKTMGNRARETALQYTWEHAADLYERLYYSLAG
ncbi:glycosyltransferase family 4 protein [uncultured Desulfobacter sp.]|uniref:glycosyltransferase family 4 protein n=2 Tax=uncultured Desulfobacter sp. TaxID=240139 RepID=UPI0029F5528D|nr:glycosyltransferase family 4 protein [uncultured Desulfobacter sp.]